MVGKSKNPNALDGKIIIIRRGLAIYKVNASPFYFARIRDSINKRNIVRSTKEISRIEARRAAEELCASIFSPGSTIITPETYQFAHFADQVMKQAIRDAETGVRAQTIVSDTKYCLYNDEYGLVHHFGKMDVRQIQTKDFVAFYRQLIERKSLSAPVHNKLRIWFRKVMRFALQDGAIGTIPEAPKLDKTKPTTRTFFRFHPLVSKENDDYKKLLRVAKECAIQRIKFHANIPPITDELYDAILLLNHGFLRPTESELYALRHSDITFAENPSRLIITVRKGKTGYRVIDTMKDAVDVYKRMKKRYPNYTKPDDYILFPQFLKRKTPKQILMAQFDYVLRKAELKQDRYTGHKHSLYSIRHTCMCMRLVLSKGRINLYALARNAGTSVEMLEKHYLKNLPNSADLARNIQSFGDD